MNAADIWAPTRTIALDQADALPHVSAMSKSLLAVLAAFGVAAGAGDAGHVHSRGRNAPVRA